MQREMWDGVFVLRTEKFQRFKNDSKSFCIGKKRSMNELWDDLKMEKN